MKVFRAVLISLFVVLIMLLAVGIIFVRYTSTKAIPDYNQNISSPQISSVVKVYRDSTAMPHLFAHNERDLYFATGYAMAQDRLWQMDLLRRLTTGRLAEIFGKDMVEVDLLFRALRFSEKSHIVLDSCQTEVKEVLKSFSAGINQYIEDQNGKLPPEFAILGYKPEKWEPLHSVNLIGYMSWSLTSGWRNEVLLYKLQNKIEGTLFDELIPDPAFHDTYIIPHDSSAKVSFSQIEEADNVLKSLGLQVFQGSNNWVISGERSATGFPLLANDMHLDLNIPGIWYQMHQVVPGKLNVSGVVLPGQPFVICGHNEDVAWGMTNVMLDDTDFYIETIKADDSLKYLLDGEWKDIKQQKEEILTKEGDTLVRYNHFTHRGPVISGFKGIEDEVISMRWIGNEFSNELRSVYLFNRMKDWSDFREAARSFISISQNIAYADKKGNIGMQITGGVPHRVGEGIFLLPGDTSLYDWSDLLDFEEMPFSYNPEAGYIVSANNKTISEDYPWYISKWYDLPNRAEGIIRGISSRPLLDINDMKDIQSDQKSVWAEKLTPFFLNQIKLSENVTGDKAGQIIDLLEKWDFSFDPDRIEPLIFEQLYIEFVRNIFLDELGEELFPEYKSRNLLVQNYVDKVRRNSESGWVDNTDTPDKKESMSDIVSASFRDMISSLETRLGSDVSAWEWGRVHRLNFEHPLGRVEALNRAFKLNRSGYPVGGSSHTVSPYSYSMSAPYTSSFGSSHRHIYSTADWDKSQIIIPTGISGIPSSVHYMDQTDDYIKYRYNNNLFAKEAIEANHLYRMEFVKE